MIFKPWSLHEKWSVFYNVLKGTIINDIGRHWIFIDRGARVRAGGLGFRCFPEGTNIVLVIFRVFTCQLNEKWNIWIFFQICSQRNFYLIIRPHYNPLSEHSIKSSYSIYNIVCIRKLRNIPHGLKHITYFSSKFVLPKGNYLCFWSMTFRYYFININDASIKSRGGGTLEAILDANCGKHVHLEN